MAKNLKVCAIDDQLLARLKKFKLRKERTTGAIVMKIDTDTATVMEDTNYDDIDDMDNLTIEELQSELPDHQPRYVALSYVLNHDDGRVSYPLVFIFISPEGCQPEMQMMYAGSKLSVINACGFTKDYELRSLEEFTEEWLVEKLKKR